MTLFPDNDPSIAFLSFSTKGSAKSPSCEKMRRAFEEFSRSHPSVNTEGEIQFDAAFSQSVGEKKAPQSHVAGKANIFIFPNLDAGNIGYKIAQYLGGYEAIGPIFQGASQPYFDLSRGANVEDIIKTSLIALALKQKKPPC